jgi:simple sugar transport system permease protein/D-xylose transport system permease protein
VLASLAVGAVIGALYGFLLTRFGVPSFVITLAGLLGILGLQLWVLGPAGSINLPFDSLPVRFAQQMFVPDALSYVLVAIAAAVYLLSRYAVARRRLQAGLSATPLTEIAVRTALLLAALLGGTWYLNTSRGVGVMFVVFIALVAVVHYLLTRTSWGRSIYAVGGNTEAARRAGIRVNRVYITVFMAGTTLAACGGLLAAARLASANQSSGGGDTNLTAIAAAVIGGTSLFGGRGNAWSALLGILVIMSISSGLTLLSLDSSVRYMVTGLVLLLAVTVDSLSRRSRASHGKA